MLVVCCGGGVFFVCMYSAVFLWPFPVHSQEQEQPLQWCVKTGSVCTR